MSSTPDKPAPIRWDTITRVADEAREEHFEAKSEQEIERELREAGFEDDAAEQILARALETAAVPRPRRRSWAPLLVAAALVLLAVLAWKRREVVAGWEGTPERIEPDRFGPDREPTPLERAASLRKKALAACDAQLCAGRGLVDGERGLVAAGRRRGGAVLEAQRGQELRAPDRRLRLQ